MAKKKPPAQPDARPRMRCLLCRKPMQSDHHFAYGVIFQATGNYGSTIHDCNGTTLEAVVHDACLLKNKRLFVGFRQPSAVRPPRVWMTTEQALKGHG